MIRNWWSPRNWSCRTNSAQAELINNTSSSIIGSLQSHYPVTMRARGQVSGKPLSPEPINKCELTSWGSCDWQLPESRGSLQRCAAPPRLWSRVAVAEPHVLFLFAVNLCRYFRWTYVCCLQTSDHLLGLPSCILRGCWPRRNKYRSSLKFARELMSGHKRQLWQEGSRHIRVL